MFTGAIRMADGEYTTLHDLHGQCGNVYFFFNQFVYVHKLKDQKSKVSDLALEAR